MMNKCEHKTIKGKVFKNPRRAIISFTGPGALTKAVWAYLSKSN